MEIIINNTVFSRNLRYLRLKHHISQKSLAAQLGISIYALRNMEAGKDEIILEYSQLKLLCKLLNTSVENLVHGDLAA